MTTGVAPAVVLLFDDAELGGQLREALQARGARIVHEGQVAGFSRELLQNTQAEVVVVNLDDANDEALDRLYDAIDGDHPRLVFNDAHASRALSGWDRARWARHLAAKVMEQSEIDPPRPEHARAVEPLAATSSEVAIPGLSATDSLAMGEHSASSALETVEARHEALVSAESENLAAELEALLAAGDQPLTEEPAVGTGLRYFNDEDLPPLHDGNFGSANASTDSHVPVAESATESAGDLADQASAEKMISPSGATSLLGHLELAPMTDAMAAAVPVASVGNAVSSGPAPVVQAPDSWALLDDTEPVGQESTPEKIDPAMFGIEKMSAAEFLAPDVERDAHGMEPTMCLELISMEEAIAPGNFEAPADLPPIEVRSHLNRIVLLGASADSVDSVRTFLAAIPVTSRVTVLLNLHLKGVPVARLVEDLGMHSTLPVRLAESARPARPGEVLIVPAGHCVHFGRDGDVELVANEAAAIADPSIDANFSTAAHAFGRDAVAIVFAGRGTDAVGGAQAVYDRKGQVWVESLDGKADDMVSTLFAERLVSFSGTPHELAAHLIEVFS